MKTLLRNCWYCNIEIPPTVFQPLDIPKYENQTPQYHVFKIVMDCPNGHPNECEVEIP